MPGGKLNFRKIRLPSTPLFETGVILLLVALGAAIWLDNLNFKQKKPHYLPWKSQTLNPDQPASEVSLPEFIRQQLELHGFNAESIAEEKTDEGLIYFSVKTSGSAFRKSKDNLLSALKKRKLKTRVDQQKTPAGENVVTIWLSQNSRTKGWIVFHYPEMVRSRKTQREAPAPVEVPAASPVKKVKEAPKVALVIDDLGEDLEFLKELINLRLPLTVAILPRSTYSRESAELAVRNGLEVIIHLPLEAFNNNHALSAGADGLITTGMSPREVRAILEENLKLLPQARGLNNHMGSKATSSQELMEVIISFLKERNLYFLDSRTTPRSIAFELALKYGVPAASRQVFLDADEARTRVKERLQELFQLARKNGQAVGIGHPFPETLEAIKYYLPRAGESGVQLVPVSALVRKSEEKR